VDQHALSAERGRLLEQRLQGGDCDDRNGCGVYVRDRGRLARNHGSRRDRVVSIAAGELWIGDAEHGIASRARGHVRTYGLDDARQIGSQGQREWLRKRALAGPDPTIPGADSGNLHPNEDFAISQAQRVLFLEADHFGTAELMDPAGFAAGNELIVHLGGSKFGAHGLCSKSNKRGDTGYFSGVVRTVPSSATNMASRLAGFRGAGLLLIR
jgi:hypothetical protein